MNTATMVAAATTAAPTQRMLHGAVVPTLMRLSTPNVVGLFASTVVIGYDGFILGRLGSEALAGVALVLPLAMLMLQMSAGGMGAATTGAVARALGAGDRALASRLAQHAMLIAIAASLLFTVLGTSGVVFTAMGGRGSVLETAGRYAGVLFGGAAVVWLTNVMAGIVRGTGEMLAAALALLTTTAVHLLLCPALVFGAGPLPALGVAGAATSTLVSNGVAGIGLALWLSRRAGAVDILRTRWNLDRELFHRILRVGLPASLSPVISNTSIALATAWMAAFGPAVVAGYGIAARLEYILVPIAFGVGSALTAMVATNLGAGQSVRAKQVTWLGSALVFAITGAIGAWAALFPAAWMNLFTNDAAIRGAGTGYLRVVGACYGFFGLGLALFFASQGAGRLLWPLVATATRMAVVATGGWLAVRGLAAPSMPALTAVIAVSFAAMGLTVGIATARSDWSR
ncbi:MATE family efflux transporter [Ramlibacter humi]|uniref:MATE family efflux transporter n=1 Tax=Ramlibacter humi TaxID=2530451 RepID=A0A4Z0BIJ9_9BURK|nr:MATE family efflux transporter [Ramlibacter humi]TFY97728.1 MATE family efflux transporter [Ramlibacter humi]